MSSMTLTELKYIVAVADQRHFGRAAESCFVSQPTLSVAIKKLEDELGLILFERLKKEIRITPAGKPVIEQARKILNQTLELKKLAQSMNDPLGLPLNFGAIYTIAPYILPYLIPEVHQSAPNMPLVIEENMTAVLAQKLQQGELDAILVAQPFDEQGIKTVPLYSEPFRVVLPSSHPLLENDYISAEELSDQNLLLLGAGHCFRDQVLEFCGPCLQQTGSTHSLQRTVEGTSLETIRHMVATGMGITVLPCSAAGTDRYSQRLLAIRRFAEPEPHRTIVLAWRNEFSRPEAITALHKALQACISQISCLTPL